MLHILFICTSVNKVSCLSRCSRSPPRDNKSMISCHLPVFLLRIMPNVLTFKGLENEDTLPFENFFSGYHHTVTGCSIAVAMFQVLSSCSWMLHRCFYVPGAVILFLDAPSLMLCSRYSHTVPGGTIADAMFQVLSYCSWWLHR